jgi:hypothetical protein
MHFHLPKPLHGWREFGGEVGIIVVGVLIALGAEQVVEELHWRNAVKMQRQALHEEISGDLSTASYRLLQEPCITRRLNELMIVFERHKAGQPLGVSGPVGSPAVLFAAEGAWETASHGQTLDHMPLDERLDLGGAFQSFASLDEELQQESRVWDDLGRLDQPDILEAADWSELRGAYAKAARWDTRVAFFAKWTLTHNAVGQKPDVLTPDVVKVIRDRPLCKPLLQSERS